MFIAKKRAREDEEREKYFERSGKRHKKNVEERERMKNDPEFKKTVIKRQATTARRNLKSENAFKKMTGEGGGLFQEEKKNFKKRTEKRNHWSSEP